MIVDFVRDLREAIDKESNEISLMTGRGGVKDWADYRYHVGLVAGLKRARDHIDELYRSVVNDG